MPTTFLFPAKNNLLTFFWSVLNRSLILHQIMFVRFNKMNSLRVLEGLRTLKAVIWLHKIESLLNCFFIVRVNIKKGNKGFKNSCAVCTLCCPLTCVDSWCILCSSSAILLYDLDSWFLWWPWETAIHSLTLFFNALCTLHSVLCYVPL